MIGLTEKTQPGGAVLLSSGRGWTPKESALVFENPNMSLRILGGNSFLQTGKHLAKVKDPMALLEKTVDQGYYAVGYFGYELFWSLLQGFKPSRKKNGLKLPDASFMFFEKDELHRERLDRWLGSAGTANVHTKSLLRSNMTKAGFVQMVEKARHYIAKGDIYQANLSQRFEVPFEMPPEQFLPKLYHAQPTPFSCCLDFGEFQLLSGSMELFLRKTGSKLVTRPIKGTRRRGKDAKADKRLRKELLESGKERAENLMIVDLMRNDLSRVCRSGSVRVNSLFEIEHYTTLYQMVSEVEGKLRDGTTVKDIIQNTFPPGSVTGAPKVRAMEIIDELEPHLRGPYCGATCLFMPNGDFTLSVAIRVLAASRGIGNFWTGGGITWGSVPEQEYEETLVKAKAMMQALGAVK